MIPPFEKSGLLPPGIHWVEWDEFAAAFGSTPRRRKLLVELKAAIDNGLLSAGSSAWRGTAQRNHRHQVEELNHEDQK